MNQAAIGAARELYDGQTAAVDGDAVPELQTASTEVGFDDQPDGTRGFLDAMDGACFFDDATEHGGEGSGEKAGWQGGDAETTGPRTDHGTAGLQAR